MLGKLLRAILSSPDGSCFSCCLDCTEFSHWFAVYSLSLLVEGPPSLLSVVGCFCFSLVSWSASPHKASLSFGGGRVELLVWVALFAFLVVVVPPLCSCSVGSSCCLLFPIPLLCSLSDT